MLNTEQLCQYNEQGFCVCRGFLSKQDVNASLEDVESICAGATLATHDATRMEMEPDQPPDGTLVRRLYEPCTHYDRFRALSDSTKLLDAVEQLIGRNLIFHYSKLNMKPPHIGSVVEWHQDMVYYPLTNRDSLAVLFYLDDADRTNGCLQIIPGLHTGPPFNHTRDGIFQGKVTQPVDESKAVLIEGEAGTAIFMHCMATHSSAPNQSSRPRRTLILSYRAADAYPIYVPEMTIKDEERVRHVRGERLPVARFTMDSFPIPRYPKSINSLYKLQEHSRAATTSPGAK
jgi:hypothetical protein